MRNFILLLLTTSLIACSGIKIVQSENDNSVNIRTYKTYDFYTMNIENESALKPQEKNLELVINAIHKEMKAKGYTMQEENADLLINIGIVITEEVQTRQTTIDEAPIYIGQRNYHWESEEVVIGTYNRGSVAIDLVDSKTKKLVWHVVASSVIDKKQEKNAGKIEKAIPSMFERFPDDSK